MSPTKTLHELIQEDEPCFRDFADQQKDHFNHNSVSTMNPAISAQETDFQLHPVDKEILESTGSLPNLPLFVKPEVLRKLAKPPSSVHTLETSCTKPPEGAERTVLPNMRNRDRNPEPRSDYTYRGFLLKTRQPEYARAVELYSDIDGDYSQKYMTRLKDCRKYAWFVQNAVTKTLRVQSSRCKLRWCPICRDVSRRILTKAVDEWLVIQKWPKMITLTIRHSDDPLKLQIKKIYACFAKLRRRAYFQRRIHGGVWFFQLKFNKKTQQWHPHIHCLVSGKFLPHNQLKALWLKITGDSSIVDIRPVRDLENASTEVARYATSPADLTAVDLDRALDIFYATKSQKICGSWGSAKKVTLKPTVQDDGVKWCRIADFYFVNVQKEHDQDAKTFWQCFILNKPYDGPQLQSDSDLYEEETDICLSVLDFPQNDKEWHLRIHRNRDGPWKTFFDQSEN